MKSILIVSRSFHPMISPRSFRTTELAKELARRGHEVTVLTPKHPEHKEFAIEHNLTIEDLGQPKWRDIKFEGSGPLIWLKRAIRRGLKIIFEYPNLEHYFQVKKALKKKKTNKEHYDLLISIAVPHSVHWGVAAVWENNNNIAETWVADCGDPFMGQENDTFKPPFYFKYVEKWFCRKVDFITVPVETAIPGYYPEFHHKIKVIPQGLNFEEVKIEKPPSRDYPYFAYAGGLIPGRRDPKEFLEYLVSVKDYYRFDIYTTQKYLIQEYADRSNGRIVLKDYLPRLELLTELSKLDFLVNFENVGKIQMPSKLNEFALLDKPILSINSFTFDEKLVKEFLQGDYTNSYVMDYPEQYRIQHVVDKFLELLPNMK